MVPLPSTAVDPRSAAVDLVGAPSTAVHVWSVLAVSFQQRVLHVCKSLLHVTLLHVTLLHVTLHVSPGLLLLGCVNALSYNLVHYLMIKHTSSVMTTVLGEMKIILILILSAMILGKPGPLCHETW
jgi:drug/metabolite transporter (DMT)-like permease